VFYRFLQAFRAVPLIIRETIVDIEVDCACGFQRLAVVERLVVLVPQRADQILAVLIRECEV